VKELEREQNEEGKQKMLSQEATLGLWSQTLTCPLSEKVSHGDVLVRRVAQSDEHCCCRAGHFGFSVGDTLRHTGS
jgi:hypothetical protein